MSSGVYENDSAVFPIKQSDTILVIDFCPYERAKMVEGLLLAGFRVASASCIGEAFYTAVSVRPDLILLAMAVPSSSGLELARSLKGDPSLREIPIVIYGNGALAEAVDDGHARFLVRAIPTGQLVAELKARIRARPLRKAHAASEARVRAAR